MGIGSPRESVFSLGPIADGREVLPDRQVQGGCWE